MLPLQPLENRDTTACLVRQGSCRDWVESRLGFRDHDINLMEESEAGLRTMTSPGTEAQPSRGSHHSALPLLPETNKPQRKISQTTPPDHYTLKPLSSHQTHYNHTNGKSSNSRSILPSYEDIHARVISSGSAPPLPDSPADAASTSPFPLDHDSTKRRTTPDLLELSNMYEHIHNKTITRTQSSPANTRPRQLISQRPELLPRPWSDTARVQLRPRQLEPLLNAPLASDRHIKIAQQRGLTGLHLSCNYSPSQWRAALDPLIAEPGKLETHTEDDLEGFRDREDGKK
eukprot:TRINITY_DN70256_c0_g1_i1.p1 TRINITY_DN70256_c0_g1~~TRINITY_DN70256_c0_g1_i1.p1  ORF type:complete len:288 (+),score=71.60 TRINITY_DN70256_c0_g1_i1:244-1107(+)